MKYSFIASWNYITDIQCFLFLNTMYFTNPCSCFAKKKKCETVTLAFVVYLYLEKIAHIRLWVAMVILNIEITLIPSLLSCILRIRC